MAFFEVDVKLTIAGRRPSLITAKEKSATGAGGGSASFLVQAAKMSTSIIVSSKCFVFMVVLFCGEYDYGC